MQVPNTTGYMEPDKILTPEEVEAGKKPRKPKKTRDMELWGAWGKDVVSPIVPEVRHLARCFVV
jgi:hypothetical protein